jgi:L-ascorbate metabolism protein UlaG (beta-lactamase superfamily)
VRLTKYTHACVRLEKDGKRLVIDPGVWTELEALDAADAILVTHEHFDHLNAELLATLTAPVWTNAGVAAQLGVLGDQVTVVSAGQAFEAAGFSVRVYGEDHAVILPEIGVPCRNTAFLVDDAVYHPGDSWTRPDRAVHTNLVPLSAPWHVMAEAVEYVREVPAEQTVNIHDGLLNERGMAIGKNWIGGQGGKPYVELAPRDAIDVG